MLHANFIHFIYFPDALWNLLHSHWNLWFSIYCAINFNFDVLKFMHLYIAPTYIYVCTYIWACSRADFHEICWEQSAGIISSLNAWLGAIAVPRRRQQLAYMKFETIITSEKERGGESGGRGHDFFMSLARCQVTHTYPRVLELWNLAEIHKKKMYIECCHALENVTEAQGLTGLFFFSLIRYLFWALIFSASWAFQILSLLLNLKLANANRAFSFKPVNIYACNSYATCYVLTASFVAS